MYKCPICFNAVFTNRVMYYTHMITEHTPPSEVKRIKVALEKHLDKKA